MQIAKHKVVLLDYVLRDGEGAVIDSSEEGDPFAYIHGIGSIVPGLENALEGRAPGDALEVSLSAEEGYGERDGELVQAVSRELFEDEDELEVGMRVEALGEDGLQVFTIVELDEQSVTLDGNHPLAGMALEFQVRVVDVRDATSEELSHGHVHGADGDEADEGDEEFEIELDVDDDGDDDEDDDDRD